MGRDLARLTGGRYRRIEIDDRTLDLEVWAPEKGDWVPVSRLSKGTIDQIYLAARIGLVRLVTQGRRPPLILDDPFVTFDDARAARAALLLRELSTDFQVIYLACSNRYDGLADAVVELPGPTDVEPASAGQAVAAPEDVAEPEVELAEPEPEPAEPEPEPVEPEPQLADSEPAEPAELPAQLAPEIEPESESESQQDASTADAGTEAPDSGLDGQAGAAPIWNSEAD
jgi:hypothetical protein